MQKFLIVATFLAIKLLSGVKEDDLLLVTPKSDALNLSNLGEMNKKWQFSTVQNFLGYFCCQMSSLGFKRVLNGPTAGMC